MLKVIKNRLRLTVSPDVAYNNAITLVYFFVKLKFKKSTKLLQNSRFCAVSAEPTEFQLTFWTAAKVTTLQLHKTLLLSHDHTSSPCDKRALLEKQSNSNLQDCHLSFKKHNTLEKKVIDHKKENIFFQMSYPSLT